MRFRSDERGVALVMALFMTLIVSAVGASMAYVARTETASSQSYATMAQARYAAESGLASAAHYLLSSTYEAQAPGTAGDPLANYDTNAAPVTVNNNPVLLSSVNGASNYPVAAVVTQFGNIAAGTLTVSNGTVTYGARARLIGMRQITDTMGGGVEILQTWEITGVGSRGGAMGSAEVEVTAIIERQTVPAFRYAAFATRTGCGALSFAGGATTKSYNSQALNAGAPVPSNNSGDVGTNGNLSLSGTPTQVYGTLSTPRTGVGSCTTSNVTALTVSGQASVQAGLVELPQVVDFADPPPISPLPPTSNVTMNSSFSCGLMLGCSRVGNVVTLTPVLGMPFQLGNVNINGLQVVLNPGTYHINSLSVAGGGNISVAGGQALVKIAGQGTTSPLTLTGNSMSNPSYNPANLQITYGGTGTLQVTGNSDAAAIVYAPKANVTLAGNSDFYGSIIAGGLNVTGSATIYYDTNLANTAVTAGNPVMSSFTWRSF
jgi:Tfp pilus assembly protein PilX